MNSTDTRLHTSPQRRLQRLLHIEASGSEVAIDYALVRHMGAFGEMTRTAKTSKINERVAIFEGNIIPVIDIRGTPPTYEARADKDFPDFLVLFLPGQHESSRLVGVRVDRVIEILLVPAHDIQSLHAGAPADFITGVVWLRTRRLPLVNMHCLLQPAAAQAMHDHTPRANHRAYIDVACSASTAGQQARNDAAPASARE